MFNEAMRDNTPAISVTRWGWSHPRPPSLFLVSKNVCQFLRQKSCLLFELEGPNSKESMPVVFNRKLFIGPNFCSVSSLAFTKSLVHVFLFTDCIYLFTSGHPEAPGQPRVRPLTSSSVALSWDAPLYTGNSTITMYLVECKDTLSDRWVCGWVDLGLTHAHIYCNVHVPVA